MTKKYIGPGEVIDWTNGTGSAVSSGDVVQVGFRQYGIALADIASAAVGSVQLEGIFELAKNSGEAWAEGDPIYWDTDAEDCTKTPLLYAFIGYAVEVEGSSDTLGKVALARFNEDPQGNRYAYYAGATATPVAIPATAFLGGNLLIETDSTTAIELDLPSVALFPLNRELEIRNDAGTNGTTVDPAATDNFDGGTDGAALTDLDAVGDRERYRSVAAGWVTVESVVA